MIEPRVYFELLSFLMHFFGTILVFYYRSRRRKILSGDTDLFFRSDTSALLPCNLTTAGAALTESTNKLVLMYFLNRQIVFMTLENFSILIVRLFLSFCFRTSCDFIQNKEFRTTFEKLEFFRNVEKLCGSTSGTICIIIEARARKSNKLSNFSKILGCYIFPFKLVIFTRSIINFCVSF